ncbi:11236_t:CDS:2 [Paraglomus occultum]|uniref:11236_t:CDS:1 n=1 Tax=Paraglomus occultum TaxID=144539 RepID=A0A9N9ADM4_9GLOM|nr:11236_t:CDS:2 [Paraglomus occultum]
MSETYISKVLTWDSRDASLTLPSTRRRKPSRPFLEPLPCSQIAKEKLNKHPWLFITLIILALLIASAVVLPKMSHSKRKSTPSRPAILKHEILSKVPNRPHSLIDDEFQWDQSFCKSSPCRYLFPVFVGGTETNSHFHLQQVALLAGRLKRTVVLPNSDGRRFSACRRSSFERYFSNETLIQASAHFSFVTQDKFFEWARWRVTEPTAQFVIMDRPPQPDEKKPRKFSDIQTLSKRQCVDDYSFDYDSYETIEFKVKPGYELSDAATAAAYSDLIAHLHSKKAYGKSKLFENRTADVLLVYYNLESPLLPVPIEGPPLMYLDTWYKETRKVIDSLRPYIAVSWAIDMLPKHIVPVCAERLVARLDEIKRETGIKNIYLAIIPSHWRENVGFHQEALTYINDHINFITWSSFQEQAAAAKQAAAAEQAEQEQIQAGNDQLLLSNTTSTASSTDGVWDEDKLGNVEPGLLTIFNQLVVEQANYFLRGTEECSRVTPFIQQVIGLREQETRNQIDWKEDILNINDREMDEKVLATRRWNVVDVW